MQISMCVISATGETSEKKKKNDAWHVIYALLENRLLHNEKNDVTSLFHAHRYRFILCFVIVESMCIKQIFCPSLLTALLRYIRCFCFLHAAHQRLP